MKEKLKEALKEIKDEVARDTVVKMVSNFCPDEFIENNLDKIDVFSNMGWNKVTIGNSVTLVAKDGEEGFEMARLQAMFGDEKEVRGQSYEYYDLENAKDIASVLEKDFKSNPDIKIYKIVLVDNDGSIVFKVENDK